MRLGLVVRSLAVVCVFSSFFLTATSFAQDPDEQTKMGRTDDPAAREQWFRKGRQTRNGEPAAKLLHKGYLQKMQRRSLRESQFRSEAQSQKSVASPLAASVGTWTNLGPRPIVDSTTAPNGYGPLAGRVTAIAIDQGDTTGNTVFAAAAYGGVWKSTNAAAADATTVQWSPIIDDQATLSVGSIALQPGNSNLILVGTGEPNYAGDSYYGVGMLRSTDGGSTWTTLTNSNDGYSFYGTGFGQIAFSTKRTNTVVAASSSATIGGFYNAFSSTALAGLWLSTDAGATWNYAPLTDNGTSFFGFSASAVVYNAKEDKFYAAVPYHGVYVSQGTSSAGFTSFKRLPNQPGASGVLSTTKCPTKTSSACPFLRGTMTARPAPNSTDPSEMYVWFVADGNGDSSDDQGIWKSTTDNSGTVTWSQISNTGIKNCGDSYGCGTKQSFYNLYIEAVPNGTNTDLYAGTINIFKCSLSSTNATCATTPFQNLTHVYGCDTISQVHPDQHAIDFLQSNPNIVYFGDDGGVNRALTAQTNLHTGTCPAGNTKANAFDNLNTHIGPLSQFVWGTNHPTDPDTLMGGTQDNGTMATSPSLAAPGDAGWWEVNAGDGGYNWIDPVTPTNWYSAYTGVSIQYCTSAINCNTNTFLPIVEEDGSQGTVHQTDNDDSNFYTPYILDPAKPTQIIVGTCRVWRGPNVSSSWPNSSIKNAVSHKLGTTSDTACSTGSGDDLIQSLAAGGPSGSNGSKVIWAGTSGGRLYMTSAATTGVATWTDVTSTINPNGFPISGIALDPLDASGLTAWVTIQGFTGTSFGHVFMTQDGGQTWNDMSGGIPDLPANDIVFDPLRYGTVYVATDAGVFSNSSPFTGGFYEVGPTTGPGYLPNVAVFHLTTYLNGSDFRLRAFTHGRGAWETALTVPQVTVSADALHFTTAVGSTSAAQTITITNSGSSSVTLPTPNIGGANPSQYAFATVSTPCTTTLAAHSSCQIGVQFAPTASGALPAVLGISPANQSGPVPTVQIILYGNATGSSNTATDFGLDFGSNPTTATVAAGTSATYTFNVTSTPASTTFSPAVTFACSGLPTKSSCTFNPTSSSSAGAVTLTISTTATTTTHLTPPAPFHSTTDGMMLAGLALPGIFLLGFAGRTRRKRLIGLLSGVTLAVLMLGLASCGGGGGSTTPIHTTIPGTPSGTYAVTVTGTYGTVTHTQAITLIVQ